MRLPRWLMEGRWIYPIAFFAAADVVVYVITLFHPLFGVAQSHLTLWITGPWMVSFGGGSLTVLVTRPLYWLRGEAVGLVLMLIGLLIYLAVAIAAGPAQFLSDLLLVAFLFGTFFEWRVVSKALRARSYRGEP